uniref:Autocrine motility factor receptor n=1 Tax=Acrobeloides nanus TaxID=290746 RepID=A0A914C7F4_9BILA
MAFPTLFNDESNQLGEIADETEGFSVDKFFTLIWKHRLLLYILLNSCCAAVAFVGRILIHVLFDNLTAQEETLLRKTFHRFVQFKLTFLFLISHHNFIEDLVYWLPWLAIFALFTLILELANLRLSNPFNVVSNKATRHKLYLAQLLGCCGSLIGMFTVAFARNYLNVHYILFMVADCSLLFVQSVHMLTKMFVLVDPASQHSQANSSFNLDFIFDIIYDAIEFVNVLHMIFYSQLAFTYCCIFLILQARYYYFRIAQRIRKHLQRQKIVYHITTCYAEATPEDMEKQETCTVCWEPMKQARKLPCGHIFHELCLRRWLEQDSSCAVCRRELNLGRVARVGVNQAPVVDEVDPTLQFILEAFSPQNNRFGRWWTRILIDSLSEDQQIQMAEQIQEMFPQISREQIRQTIRMTGSMNQAIEALLNRGDNQPENPNRENLLMENRGDEFESDDAESNTDDETSNQDMEMHEESPPVAQLSQPWESNNKNIWFGDQRRLLVESNRRRYLASPRAIDIRHLYENELKDMD